MLTPSQVHLDAPLTNLTLAWVQDESNFIADKVFPTVSVDKQSDKYYIYNRGEFNRAGQRKALAPRTRPERIGMSLSNSTYTAEVYGLATDFDEQTLANEDAALETRLAGSTMLMHNMLIDREVDWATNYFATSVWTNEVAGDANGSVGTGEVVYWSDYTNSTPIQDVTNARRTVQLQSGGFKPNTMVVGKAVRDKLVNHPDILARLNGGATVTNTALITDAKLAEIFEVENFFVMEAIKNTAAEGATESNSFIGGNHAMLCYTPSSAGLMTPAAGLTFTWDSIPGVSMGMSVESFTGDFLRVEGIAEELHVKCSYDMKVVGADLGYFFKDIIA
tara:strand:- start:2750 stop:3751 length:1002 start_codon:yes stop_codon:yes gene_type:complete